MTRTAARFVSLVAVALAACGGGSGGRHDADTRASDADTSTDGATAAGEARIDAVPQVFAELQASWSITNVAGAAQPCPDGFPTAVLVAKLNGMGPPIYDLFDCASGIGRATYEVGAYTFELDIANNNDAIVYAASIPQPINLAVDTPAAFPLVTDAGYYDLSWTLVGAVSGAPLACADVVGLDAVAVAVAGPTTATARYACAAGGAISAALPTGAYAATVTAEDAAMAVLGSAPPLTGEMVGVLNRVTSWGSVQIAIAGR